METSLVALPAAHERVTKRVLKNVHLWIKKNWGLASFVASFLHVVRDNSTLFRLLVSSMRTFDPDQSVEEIINIPGQRQLLCIQLHKVYTHVRGFAQ